MKRVKSNIEFQTVTFPFSNQISIESSYDTITDTANIVVPKKIKFKDSDGNEVQDIASGPNAVFKRGDTVQISLGYNESLKNRFNGYISGVRTKNPLEFACEDDTYFLKQNSITLTLKNPKLSKLIAAIMPEGVNYKIWADRNLGDFRMSRVNVAQVLNELRKKHGIYSWFRGGTLNIGLAVVPELQKTVRFTMFKDIINADSLQFINDFDRLIKVVAKSINSDNTQLTAEAGDHDGDVRTLHLENVDSIEDLQAFADSKVSQMKYSGYEGDLKTFGGEYFDDQFVDHGDIVEIVNPQIPEQSGAYVCDKVVTECGMNGIRQMISIKQKVYDLAKNSSGVWVRV